MESMCQARTSFRICDTPFNVISNGSSFVIKSPLLGLGLPKALQSVVEADGAVAQEQPHIAAHVGDETAPLVSVVVNFLLEPGWIFN